MTAPPATDGGVMPITCAESEAAAALATADSQVHRPLTSARFNAVYEQHIQFVWRNVQRLGVRDAAAEDVVQSVLIVIFRRLDEFEGRSAVKTWIYGIVLRVVRDHRRTMRRKSPSAVSGSQAIDPASLVAPANERPDVLADRAAAAHLVRELLDSLDDDKRDVFVMAELEVLTLREIAGILGEPLGTIASRLRAARADFERAARRHRAQEQGRRAALR